MRTFAADLHVHTALSPCAEDEMTPPEIVRAALEAGLDIMAVCDHNTAGNAAAVQEAAVETAPGKLAVIAGIEITTREEVHLLGLFPDAGAAEAVGEQIRSTLPERTEASKRLGNQWLLDAHGRVLREEVRMLTVGSGVSLSDAAALVRRHDGLAIAAHVDHQAFSVPSQLGMFPEDLSFDAIEISAAGMASGRFADFMSLDVPMITSSDAHFLSALGESYSLFQMEAPTFEEIRWALQERDGRKWGFA